jgi:hypothetical protein
VHLTVRATDAIFRDLPAEAGPESSSAALFACSQAASEVKLLNPSECDAIDLGESRRPESADGAH